MLVEQQYHFPTASHRTKRQQVITMQVQGKEHANEGLPSLLITIHIFVSVIWITRHVTIYESKLDFHVMD
jgi:hypothetical protein